MTKRILIVPLLLSILLAVGNSVCSAEQTGGRPPAGTRLTLRLTDALLKNGPKDPSGTVTRQPTPLSIYATVQGSDWSDVWAYEYNYNHRTHNGRVNRAVMGPDEWDLSITVELQTDPWAAGGVADYFLRLKPVAGQDGLQGTFTGQVKAGPQTYQTHGAVSTKLLPPLQTLPDFRPVQHGEHPRLLLRKYELAALRQRMRTPLGQMLTALMSQSEDGPALGVMYQLTGDKAFASRCADACRKTMAETGGGAFAVGRVWGYRVLAVAYDFDLCYDAWDQRFKKQCEAYLDHYCYALLYKPQTLGTPNIHPGSNYMFVMSGGAGVAAMALWGESDEDLPPFVGEDANNARRAKPAAGSDAMPADSSASALDSLGGSRRWARMVVDGRRLNYENIRRGYGDGGFQPEGEEYTLECSYVAFDYDLAYRHVFGTDLTGRPDISHFVPRYVETVVFSGQRDPNRVWQNFSNQTYGRGDNLAADWKYLSRCMPLTPDAWKPAVLWYWFAGAGVDDFRSSPGLQQLLTRPRDAKGSSRWLFNDTSILMFTFLHVPLELKPRNPENLFPHVWQASGKGFYAFRNHWSGPDDIVAQIYAKSGPPVGWNQMEAGCFQIQGLGHVWAGKDPHGGLYGKTGSRWQDNVVMLPDDPIDPEGHGVPVFFSGDSATGTGVVTFNMDQQYAFVQAGADPKAPRQIVDGGVRGTRSFAADYSGKSGAPALFAVSDHISGGGRKIWVYQLPHLDPNDRPRKGEKPKPVANVTIEEHGFTLAYPDASCKVTFVTPRNVRIDKAKGAGANKLSEIPDSKDEAIHVTGEDSHGGDFLALITLQKGPAPAVRPQGSGAVVGSRIVRLEGDTITLGQ